MPKRLVSRWLRRFSDHHSGEDETVEGLKSISHLLGFNAIFMGSFFFGVRGILTWPDPGEMVGLWHIDPLGLGIWDVLFPVAGIWLIVATFLMKGVVKAHMFSALVWLSMGVAWVTYSFLFQPDYVFGIGVLSIFVSAQHFVYTRLWKAEGVE